MGRPSKYTEELSDQICRWLASGGSLNSYCKQPDTPSISTVMLWLFQDKHKGFMEKYARAREAQAEYYADQIIDIADQSERDLVITEDGIEQKNNEVLERTKIRIDARKWIASKLQPKKYGTDRIDHTTDGEPLNVVIEWKKPDPI